MTDYFHRLIRRYPYLTVCFGGFFVMVSPVFIGLTLLFQLWYCQNTTGVPLVMEDMYLRGAFTFLSPVGQRVGWTTFGIGFVVMIVGWILHCRKRTTL
jgi:hypothetical protein